MEIFWESFKEKKILLFLLFLGFLLFLFIVFTGTKIIKQNKLGGVLVKSRLLCKMLYNVFTISTYQN